MAQSDHRDQLDSVTFHCRRCRLTWDAVPARVEESAAESDIYHPWRYFATCEICEQERSQAPWQRALLKAWQSKPGPRSPEGIAKVTANLKGHPTPEEAKRTRFNAMKHGLHAKVAKYFPAKPDGYAFCATCEVDRVWCAEQSACVKRAENFMLHHAAFEAKDPKHLQGLYADLQAAVFATLEQILQTIIADGVKITNPVYHFDKEGNLCIGEYTDEHGEKRTILEINSHPLFKPLGELISRVGLSLSDMGITQRSIDGRETDEDMGRLKTEDARPALDDYRERQTKALESLVDLVSRANEKTARDPVLIEFNEQQGGGT